MQKELMEKDNVIVDLPISVDTDAFLGLPANALEQHHVVGKRVNRNIVRVSELQDVDIGAATRLEVPPALSSEPRSFRHVRGFPIKKLVLRSRGRSRAARRWRR